MTAPCPDCRIIDGQVGLCGRHAEANVAALLARVDELVAQVMAAGEQTDALQAKIVSQDKALLKSALRLSVTEQTAIVALERLAAAATRAAGQIRLGQAP